MISTNQEEDKYLAYSRIALLVFEGIILLGITLAFWFHIGSGQPMRDAWFWTLWLAVPIFFLRWKLWGYLWTHTRLHDLIIIFIILSAFNYFTAPFHRESYLAAMARPLSGIWTFIYFIELTRARKRLTEVMIVFIGMSFCIALFALTASQWLPKSGFLWFFIDMLPKFDYRSFADSLEGQVCSPFIDMIHRSNCFNPRFVMRNAFLSFNVNEIGGVLSRLAPVMAGISLMAQFRKVDEKDKPKSYSWLFIRIVAVFTFILLFSALLFGQSRFAILGLIVSLTILAFVVIPPGKWRYLALIFIGVIVFIQASLLLNLFTPNTIENDNTVGLSARDENSVETRLAIWNRAIRMMLDYPATGIGMYKFRVAVGTETYQIPHYVQNNSVPPHAHNDFLNMGAEMGVTGLALYIAMQVVTLQMLWYGWKHGDYTIRTIALATFSGVLSGAIFGIGDTIAIWDRFQFVIWWLLGLAGAQYILAQMQNNHELSEVVIENSD